MSGLAEATIVELKKKGFFIFALDIRNEEREEDGTLFIKTDLTKNEDIERARKIVETKTDKLDFIANFSGCVILGSFFEKAEGKVERIFALNLFATFNFNRVFIPLVIKGKGTIAVISSEYGKIAAIPLHGYYPMSKHAVELYGDSLRRELKKSGAKVTTIRPGAFKTNMQAHHDRRAKKSKRPGDPWKKTCFNCREKASSRPLQRQEQLQDETTDYSPLYSYRLDILNILLVKRESWDPHPLPSEETKEDGKKRVEYE